MKNRILGFAVLALLGCGTEDKEKKGKAPNSDNELFERLKIVELEIEKEYKDFAESRVLIFDDVADIAKRDLSEPIIVNRYLEKKEEALGYLEDIDVSEIDSGFRAQGFGLMALYRAKLIGWVKYDRETMFQELRAGLDKYLECSKGLVQCYVELDQRFLALKKKYKEV